VSRFSTLAAPVLLAACTPVLAPDRAAPEPSEDSVSSELTATTEWVRPPDDPEVSPGIQGTPCELVTWYEDADGDGHGSRDGSRTSCLAPEGWVAATGDCDDSDDAIHPEADELCDGLDNDCDGGRDEIRVPEEHASIQGGLDNAEDGDLVCVAPGLYSETLDLRGVEVHLWGEGGPQQTVVNGLGAGSVLSAVSGEPVGTRVQGFTLMNGASMVGAGVKVIESTLSLIDVLVVANVGAPLATDLALGAGVYGRDATLRMDRVHVLDNVLQGGEGAELSGAGIALVDSELVAHHTRISGNRVLGLDEAACLGAGLAVIGSDLGLSQTRVSMNACQVQDGGQAAGGALYAEDSSLVLANDLLYTNAAATGAEGTSQGGALHLLGSTAWLINVDLARNQAVAGSEGLSEGGALYVEHAEAFVVNTGLVENRADGGAVEGAGAIAVAGGGWLDVGSSNSWDNGPVPFTGTGDPLAEDDNLSVRPGYREVYGDDPAQWDFHLASDSPLVDAGNADLMDPDGSRSDIGAYGGPNGAW